MPARYYTYAKEEDFARAGTLLREYKLNELKYVQGISLSLRSWTNKEYWGQEQE